MNYEKTQGSRICKGFERQTNRGRKPISTKKINRTILQGQKYGIYLDFKGSGKGHTIDYFMYGRLTGLRTIKGNDINFPPNTCNLPDLPAGTIKGGKKNHKPSDFEKGKRNYKTNCSGIDGKYINCNRKFGSVQFGQILKVRKHSLAQRNSK